MNATTRRVAVVALVCLAEAAHTRRDSIAAESYLDRAPRRQFPHESLQPSERPNTQPSGSHDETHVENASRVVAGLRGEFRNCYNKALAEDPTERGSIQLKLDVAADGTLSEVTGMSVGISKLTADCVVAASASRRFMPPQEGHAVIRIPVTFVKH